LFTSSRIYIVPFERHFDEKSQDHTLKDEFEKPENQSGILNWLIEGYRQLKEIGLSPSAAISAATESYHYDSDKIAQFVEEVLNPDPNGEERTSAVYKQYQAWCNRNGCFAENSRNFKQAMSAVARIVRKRPRSGGSETTMLLGYTLPGNGNNYEQRSLWDETGNP
jgi:putative DNA primase/helicase